MLGAVLIMLPVVLMLLYVYRVIVIKLQQRSLDKGDYIAVPFALISAVIYMYWILHQDWSSSGPIWPTILAPMGAYHIFAFGLAAYLYYRKVRAGK